MIRSIIIPYACPVWERSSHAKKVDASLNSLFATFANLHVRTRATFADLHSYTHAYCSFVLLSEAITIVFG